MHVSQSVLAVRTNAAGDAFGTSYLTVFKLDSSTDSTRFTKAGTLNVGANIGDI